MAEIGEPIVKYLGKFVWYVVYIQISILFIVSSILSVFENPICGL